MKNKNIIKEFAEQQYKTHQNLENRMKLWSYGSNPESLPKWIFSKIQLQEYEKVLELGCGTGQLWLENFNTIPLTCSIILSDFSEKMIKKAEENLQPYKLPITYEIIDAEKIPYPDKTFDVVVGCHMLYHISNIQKTLKSVKKILKPGGRFIATTNSQVHLRELKDFLSEFDLYSGGRLKFFSEFRNESGREVLKPYFSEIQFYEYNNNVNITSVEVLMKYIESMFLGENFTKFQRKKAEVETAIIKILEEKSFFKITGISGLFKAKNL